MAKGKSPKAKRDDAGGASKQAGIQSVEIGMRVLEALGESSSPMSLTQICAATDMAASKVHRYLVSFVRTGMLMQYASTGQYDFGPTTRRLGISAWGRLDEFSLASDYVVRLRESTGHAVALAVWGDNGPTIVRWEVGVHPLLMNIRLGSSLPLAGSSSGRVFMAYMPRSTIKPILKRQSELARSQSASAADLDQQLESIREKGLSAAESALIPGIDAISAPVLNAQGAISSVVTLLAPHKYFSGKSYDRLTGELIKTTRNISRELGFSEAD